MIVRRSYRMTQGVPYSALRLAAVAGLILVLWTLSELESLLLTPWAFPYLIGLDVAIIGVVSTAFAGGAERITTVYRDSSGARSYRMGFSLAALFLGAFLVRLTLTIALFPTARAFGSPPSGFPPESQQVVLAVIDGVFSFSVGLLIARAVGARRKWLATRATWLAN